MKKTIRDRGALVQAPTVGPALSVARALGGGVLMIPVNGRPEPVADQAPASAGRPPVLWRNGQSEERGFEFEILTKGESLAELVNPDPAHDAYRAARSGRSRARVSEFGVSGPLTAAVRIGDRCWTAAWASERDARHGGDVAMRRDDDAWSRAVHMRMLDAVLRRAEELPEQGAKVLAPFVAGGADECRELASRLAHARVEHLAGCCPDAAADLAVRAHRLRLAIFSWKRIRSLARRLEDPARRGALGEATGLGPEYVRALVDGTGTVGGGDR